MPGYPTRQTLRIPWQACLRAGVRHARLGRDGNPEAPVTRAERGAAMPGPRAPVPHVRGRPERISAAGDRRRPRATARVRLRPSRKPEHQTTEMDYPREHPRADVRTSAFPGGSRRVRAGRRRSRGLWRARQQCSTACSLLDECRRRLAVPVRAHGARGCRRQRRSPRTRTGDPPRRGRDERGRGSAVAVAGVVSSLAVRGAPRSA